MPLADVVTLSVSAAALLGGACSVWYPSWITYIPHWAALIVFGCMMAIAWGAVQHDRKLKSKATKMVSRITNTVWGISALVDLLILAPKALTPLDQGALALAAVAIASLQLCTAWGLWVHRVALKNTRIAV